MPTPSTNPKNKSDSPKPQPRGAARTFLFHGPDTYSSQEKLNLWKTQFALKYGGDFNTNEIEGKLLTYSQFKSETESLPFGAEKRLTIIKNFLTQGNKDDQKLIAERIDHTPEHSVIIFHETSYPDKRISLFKRLQKSATIEEFTPPENFALTQWVNKKAIQHKAQFTGQSATLLTSLIGPNLWQLNNEIAKLATYANNRTITEEDVKALVSQNFSESIFSLTDAIATKRPQQSLKTLHALISGGEDIPRIFYMIVRHFRILIQVKDLLTQNKAPAQIVTLLKLHPFVVKNTITQARNFTPTLLVLIYRQLLKIEIEIKSGKIRLLVDDKRDLILKLESLILKLCK